MREDRSSLSSLVPGLSLSLPSLQHLLSPSEAKAGLCRAPGVAFATPAQERMTAP